MKYTGLNFDIMDDQIVCWVELADAPKEIQAEAKRIDGKNFDKTCFGMCVVITMDDKECFVSEEAGEGNNIYYIDAYGNKNGFNVELSPDFYNDIFQKCLDEVFYTKTHCKTDCEYKGKIIAVYLDRLMSSKTISKIIQEDLNFSRNKQLFYVTDVKGDAVMSKMLDAPYPSGVYARFNREDIIGVVKKEFVPHRLLLKAKNMRNKTKKEKDNER